MKYNETGLPAHPEMEQAFVIHTEAREALAKTFNQPVDQMPDQELADARFIIDTLGNDYLPYATATLLYLSILQAEHFEDICLQMRNQFSAAAVEPAIEMAQSMKKKNGCVDVEHLASASDNVKILTQARSAQYVQDLIQFSQNPPANMNVNMVDFIIVTGISQLSDQIQAAKGANKILDERAEGGLQELIKIAEAEPDFTDSPSFM